MYNKERVNGTVYSGHSTSWTGKVAIPYPSDYGYAADLSLCQKTLYEYDNSTCTANNWMKNILGTSSYGWLLTPGSGDASIVCDVGPSGYVGNANDAYSASGVVPVLYLNSKIGIKSGTGTSSNPYQLNV